MGDQNQEGEGAMPDLDQLDMKELRALADKLGMDKFPVGTSKADAADAIRAVMAVHEFPLPGEPGDLPDAPQRPGDGPDADEEAPLAADAGIDGEDDAPEEDPVEDRRPLERVSEHTGTWWCPYCDHASRLPILECRGCGARLDMDTEEVIR